MWTPVPTRLAMVMWVGLLAFGCEKSNDPTVPTTPHTVSIEGGSVSFDDGRVRLDVPAGALGRPVTFSATVEDSILPDLGARRYRLGPAGTEFAEPAVVTIKVDLDAINDVAELKHVTGAVYGNGEWVGVPTLRVDETAGTVSFEILAIADPEFVDPRGDVGDGDRRGGGSSLGLVTGFVGAGSSTCRYRLVARSASQFSTYLPKYVAANGTGDDIFDGAVTRPWATLSNSVRRLRFGQRLVVRGGGEFVNQPLVAPGLGVETFPIRLATYTVIEGENATVRIQPHPARITPDALFLVDTDGSRAVVSGLTVESERMPNPAAGDVDRDRIAIVSNGSPTFLNIDSKTTSGYEVRNTSASMGVVGGSLRNSAARIEISAGIVTISGTTFRDLVNYADAESAAVFMRGGDVCVENVSMVNTTYGIQAPHGGSLTATGAVLRGNDTGIMLGRIGAGPATVTATINNCQFQGFGRSGLTVSTTGPVTGLAFPTNRFPHEPPTEWHGPPPFLAPIDVAYVLDPIGRPQWWALNRGEPSDRFGADGAYENATGVFLLFGGRTPSGALDDTWSFDTRSLAWTEVTPASIPPDARYDHMMASVLSRYRTTNNVFMIGGHTGGSPDRVLPMNEIWMYESTTNDWTLVTPSGGPPTPRYAATWVASHEEAAIDLFGGIDTAGNVLGDMWRYDINANQWTELPASGAAGTYAYHGAAPFDHGILYYGGMTAIGGAPTDDMFIVQADATFVSTVSQRGNRPDPRLFSSFDRVHDAGGQPRFMSFGGSDALSGEYTGSGHIFHADDFTTGLAEVSGFWTTLDLPASPLTPTPRGRATMIQWLNHLPNDNVLVFGGVDNDGNVMGDSYILMAGGGR